MTTLSHCIRIAATHASFSASVRARIVNDFPLPLITNRQEDVNAFFEEEDEEDEEEEDDDDDVHAALTSTTSTRCTT